MLANDALGSIPNTVAFRQNPLNIEIESDKEHHDASHLVKPTLSSERDGLPLRVSNVGREKISKLTPRQTLVALNVKICTRIEQVLNQLDDSNLSPRETRDLQLSLKSYYSMRELVEVGLNIRKISRLISQG